MTKLFQYTVAYLALYKKNPKKSNSYNLIKNSDYQKNDELGYQNFSEHQFTDWKLFLLII